MIVGILHSTVSPLNTNVPRCRRGLRPRHLQHDHRIISPVFNYGVQRRPIGILNQLAIRNHKLRSISGFPEDSSRCRIDGLGSQIFVEVGVFLLKILLESREEQEIEETYDCADERVTGC